VLRIVSVDVQRRYCVSSNIRDILCIPSKVSDIWRYNICNIFI